MTWAQAGDRASATVRWVLGHLELVLLGGLVVALALIVGQCSRAGRAEKGAAAATERAQLEAQRIAVAHAYTAEGLARMIAAAVEREKRASGRASDLEAEVRRLLAAAPGAHVVSAETGDTGWIPTGGGGDASAPEPGGGLSAAPSGGAPPPGRACLFYEGDEGRIRTASVRARYQAGTVGVVGVASAFGRAPPPAAAAAAGVNVDGWRLFGAPLTIDAAQLDDAPRPPGWAYGLGGGASGQGVLGALKVDTPPATLPLWLGGVPIRGWGVLAGGSSQGLVVLGVSIEP